MVARESAIILTRAQESRNGRVVRYTSSMASMLRNGQESYVSINVEMLDGVASGSRRARVQLNEYGLSSDEYLRLDVKDRKKADDRAVYHGAVEIKYSAPEERSDERLYLENALRCHINRLIEKRRKTEPDEDFRIFQA